MVSSQNDDDDDDDDGDDDGDDDDDDETEPYETDDTPVLTEEEIAQLRKKMWTLNLTRAKRRMGLQTLEEK